MAASTTQHAHFHRPTLTREKLAFGWPHQVAAGLLVVIGAAFVAVTLAANLFNVGPAFDRLTNDFRPIMTQKAIQTDRQDIASLQAASTEIQNKMMPALAQQLGMTPAQFSTMMTSQYPDVSKGLAAVPQITPSFSSLVTTLDEQRPYFKAADAIPTSSVPATSVPWSLFAVGLLTAGLGVWVWFRPRGSAIVATVVGAALIAVPLALNMPHKASYADTMNDNLKPVYTPQLITQANSSLATLSAMGTEMQQKMLPGLATQLKMSPEQLNTFMTQNFPDTTAALATLPASLGRFQHLVQTFDGRLSDYNDTLEPVSFVPIVQFMIGGGVALFLLGGAGVLITRRGAAQRALHA
ncbi:MAG TPA: hypothetical protein VHO29_08760 [Marmoricola sp.]|nr:hypothetical protein [Marmoricola sp.]